MISQYPGVRCLWERERYHDQRVGNLMHPRTEAEHLALQVLFSGVPVASAGP